MSNATWLDNLKLRAGFGVTGVIPTSSYLSKTIYKLGSPYYYDDGTWKQGLNVASNPNPDLQWEKSTEYNIGLDWAVLGNRLSGTIDVYNKKTTGMLWEFSVPTPPNLYNRTLANVGEMQNKGIEIAINATPVETKDFTWKTTATFVDSPTLYMDSAMDITDEIIQGLNDEYKSVKAKKAKQ